MTKKNGVTTGASVVVDVIAVATTATTTSQRSNIEWIENYNKRENDVVR